MKNAPLSQDEVDRALAELASKGIQLPAQPRLVQQVSSLLSSGNYEMRDLAALIASDPGLTALLFRLTRSPLFARRKPPDSVEHALTLVGARRLLSVVRSYCLTQALPGNRELMEQFWARSTAIAQFASLIAGELGAGHAVAPEQAYMAGIFHDCGVPVLMQRFPAYCRALALEAQMHKWADIATEDRAFNVDHCVIGYLLARHWALPDFVAEAIRHHHELRQLDNHHSRGIVAVLQLAFHLYAREHRLDDTEWPAVEALVLEELGLHAGELTDFCDEVQDAYQMMAAD